MVDIATPDRYEYACSNMSNKLELFYKLDARICKLEVSSKVASVENYDLGYFA